MHTSGPCSASAAVQDVAAAHSICAAVATAAAAAAANIAVANTVAAGVLSSVCCFIRSALSCCLAPSQLEFNRSKPQPLLFLFLLPQASKAGKPQQWLVRDMQGNSAHVTAADLGEGGHRVHVIDRVLYSGESLTPLVGNLAFSVSKQGQ